jgi:hypothetical protein
MPPSSGTSRVSVSAALIQSLIGLIINILITGYKTKRLAI